MHWNAETLDTKFSICWMNSCTVNGLRILDIDFVQQEYWIISVRSNSENADTLLASIYSSGRADASAARRMQEEVAKATKRALGGEILERAVCGKRFDEGFLADTVFSLLVIKV